MNIADIKAMLRGKSYEQIKKMQSKDTKKSGVLTFKRSFNASQMLAELANAKTKSQVNAIERSIRAQIPGMQKQSGSEEAVRQMKAVIQKANDKCIALSKEERLDNYRKVSKNAGNKKQEARFESELIKRRRSRERREIVDALNAPDVFAKKEPDALIFDETCSTFDTGADMNQCVGGVFDALL